MTADFIRYLAAKRTVDDRALNRGVWEALAQALPGERPVDVLELGAGIGTMIERCLEWHLLNTARYTALDVDPGYLAAAQARMRGWAERQGWQVGRTRPGDLRLEGDGRRLDLEFEVTDAFVYAESHRGRRAWDLLIAHAFLDLVDIPAVLPALLALLRPGGLFYFTITFDGVTSFQPEIDQNFDALVEACYHETMDRRLIDGRPSGDSRSGRHLFGHLQAARATVLAAGASDWVVFPQHGGYAGDEAYFLHFIVNTLNTALAGPSAGHSSLDPDRLGSWVAARHRQIDSGELVYVAHQLDVAGRVG